ncbi:MAG TPA: hypothetical protein VF733_01275 [Candidatus Saccharimonadales bacterium]
MRRGQEVEPAAVPNAKGFLFLGENGFEYVAPDTVLDDFSTVQRVGERSLVGTTDATTIAESNPNESDSLVPASEMVDRYLQAHPHVWVMRITNIRQSTYPSGQLTAEQKAAANKDLLAEPRVVQTSEGALVLLGEPGPQRDNTAKLLAMVQETLLELAQDYMPNVLFPKKDFDNRLNRLRARAGEPPLDAFDNLTVKQFLTAHTAVEATMTNHYRFVHKGYTPKKGWLTATQKALTELRQAKPRFYDHASLLTAIGLRGREGVSVVFIESLLAQYGFMRLGRTDTFVGSTVHKSGEYAAFFEQIESMKTRANRAAEELIAEGFSSVAVAHCLECVQANEFVDELRQIFLMTLTAHPHIEVDPVRPEYLKVLKQANVTQQSGRIIRDFSFFRGGLPARSSTVNFSSLSGGRHHGKKGSKD